MVLQFPFSKMVCFAVKWHKAGFCLISSLQILTYSWAVDQLREEVIGRRFLAYPYLKRFKIYLFSVLYFRKFGTSRNLFRLVKFCTFLSIVFLMYRKEIVMIFVMRCPAAARGSWESLKSDNDVKIIKGRGKWKKWWVQMLVSDFVQSAGEKIL